MYIKYQDKGAEGYLATHSEAAKILEEGFSWSFPKFCIFYLVGVVRPYGQRFVRAKTAPVLL